MNKRIKKKRELENKVTGLFAFTELLQSALNKQNQRINELERLQSQNTRAANANFEQLEAENKALRIDLDKAIIEFKKPKRSLFGRK